MKCAYNRQSAKKGFTLSELLISLAILGLIAGFAVPKVVQVVQEQHKKAVLKETYALLSPIFWEGYSTYTQTLDGNAAPPYYADLEARLNSVKSCAEVWNPNNCINPSVETQYSPLFFGPEEAFLLPNGATVGTALVNGTVKFVYIDYNGAAGPNALGEDTLALITYYTTHPALVSAYNSVGLTFRQGVLLPDVTQSAIPAAVNVALYKELFN